MPRTFLKIALFGAVAITAGHLLGFDWRSLVVAAESDLAQASADAADLVSGEYSQRTADRLGAEAAHRLREEAAKLPVAAGDDLNRELMAERKRLLQEKAEMAERVAGDFLAGDLDSLKRQVEENSRRAGGNP